MQWRFSADVAAGDHGRPRGSQIQNLPQPGAANQKILTVGQFDRDIHLAHGDHEVGQEMCDGDDDDCDRVVDDDCIATCPSECVREVNNAAGHDITGHEHEQACGYDTARAAGAVSFIAQIRDVDHEDDLQVKENRCFVRIATTILHDADLSDAEQQACAPFAEQAVERITGQECDISPQ